MFYCYSFRLSLFLRSMKQKYKHVGINHKTNTKFWVFEKSERLDALISLWNEIKNK